MTERTTNVGPGMAPCRKGCRCDDCEIERLQARARIAKQWTYCPECGSRDTASHDVLGSGSRVCADCGQDWWIDSDYTDVVRRNLEQWQEAEKPTRIAEQREAELVEALDAALSMIEHSLSGLPNPDTGSVYRKGVDDLALNPDGSMTLLKARTILAKHKPGVREGS